MDVWNLVSWCSAVLWAINYLLIQSWFKCHVNDCKEKYVQHGWIFCRSNSLSNVSSSLSQYLHDLVRAFSSRTEKIKENTIQPPTPSSLSEVDVASEANSGNSYLAVCLCSLFVCPSFCLSLTINLKTPVFLRVCRSLSLSLSVSLCLSLSVCLSLSHLYLFSMNCITIANKLP